jgi:UDP-N-acetyl-D-mannosaminuronate dehydrogenase
VRRAFHVTGVDPDKRKIDALIEGKSYIPDVKTEDVAKPLSKMGNVHRHNRFFCFEGDGCG